MMTPCFPRPHGPGLTRRKGAKAAEAAGATRPGTRRSVAGFTLIEIMVVLVIIGVLAALIAPNVLNRAADARVTAARTDVNNLMQALKLYKLDNQRYPSAEQGLEALVRKPSAGPNAPNWKPYLDKLPPDPWGRAYQYFNLETERGNGQARQRKNLKPLNTDYDLYSIGRDGETSKVVSDDTALDDVVRGLNGRFTGFAKDLDATASSK